MKGFGRSFRYWCYILERQFLMLVSMMTAIVCLMSFMEGGDFLEEIKYVFPMYIVLMMFMTAFMNALNGSSIYFPVSISLGATRKASSIAIQIVQHMIMVEYMIIGVVFLALLNREQLSALTDYALLIIGVVALVLGTANIVTIINYKAGKKAAMIMYFVLIFAVGAIVGALGAIYGDGFFSTLANNLVDKQYLGLIGIVYDLVIVAIFYKVVKKSNIQF